MAAPNALQIQALKARLLILDLSNPDAEVIIGELANALGHTVIDISQTGTGDFEIELNTRTHPTFKDFINSIRATGLPEAQYDDLNDVVAANTAAFAPRSRVKSDAELLTEEIGKTFTGGAVDPKVDAFLKRVTKGKGYVLSKDPISNEMSIAVNGGAAQDLCDYLDANARPADIHKALGALKPAKAPADPKKDSVLGGVLDNDILKKLTGDMVYACQHVTNDAADEIDSRANKRAWGFGLATFVATLPTFPLNVLIGAAIGKLVYEGSSRLDHYISPEKLAPKVAAVNGLRDYLVTALQKGEFDNPVALIAQIEKAMTEGKDVGAYKDLVRKKHEIRTPEEMAIAVMECRCSGLGRHDRKEIAGLLRQELQQRDTVSAASFGGKKELFDAAQELKRTFQLSAVVREKEESKGRWGNVGAAVGGGIGFVGGLASGGLLSGVFGAAGAAIGGWLTGYVAGEGANRLNDFGPVKKLLGDYGATEQSIETLEKLIVRQVQEGKVKPADLAIYLRGLEDIGIHPKAIENIEVGKRLMSEVESNLLNRSGATAALETAISTPQFDELKEAVKRLADAVDSPVSGTDLATIRRHKDAIAEHGPKALSEALEAALTVLGKEAGSTGLGALAAEVKAARVAAEARRGTP